MGVGVSVASVALGATVIEKHFTLARADGGVDSSFSLEPHEMASLVTEIARAWQALGTTSYGPTDAELKSLKYRRGLRVTQDIKAGELLTAENVRAIRPGGDLSSKYTHAVIGRRARSDLVRGTALAWDLIA
jgi:N-acetylneuraminate synthase